eukprot:Hpha_TRINITY_DN12589_c0_g1::TRINITY_DN12589_c0_g1_i1::g.50755::m.50755/K00106/XDH; xanthine dehydrogenase/oxidase
MSGDVVFTLNSHTVHVPVSEAKDFRVAEYLRNKTRFRGLKIGCAQAGCGACTVAVLKPGASHPVSVASCLVPLPALHGCSVTTVEGLAKGPGGPHPVQKRLAALNGTQCGYCTPGVAMQIFATLAGTNGGRDVKEADLEQAMNGNICRCTGYRPIVDTLKSFASDTTVKDNLGGTAVGPYDAGIDKLVVADPPIAQDLSTHEWYIAKNLDGAVKEFEAGRDLMAGHTSPGIYDTQFSGDTGHYFPNPVVDITRVPELCEAKVTASSLEVGAAVTWAKLSETLKALLSERPQLHSLLASIHERVSTIAGHQVRNSGTVGGNITLIRTRGFASDLGPVLLALDAKVNTAGRGTLPFAEFISIDAQQRVFVTGVTVPLPGDEEASEWIGKSYRVALRSHNSYALGALTGVARRDSSGQVSSVRIAVGAVPHVGKPFLLESTAAALAAAGSWEGIESAVAENVQKDLSPLGEPLSAFGKHGDPRDGNGQGTQITEYQAQLVRGFAHKFAVAIAGDRAPEAERPSVTSIHDKPRRTYSHQTWADHRSAAEAPAFEPLNKTTGLGQTTGDCKFSDDSNFQGLNAAYLPCPGANVKWMEIDDAPARKAFGAQYHGILLSTDVPNNTIPTGKRLPKGVPAVRESLKAWEDELLLLPKDTASEFDGQPIAIVLARGPPSVALRAAQLITVKTDRVGPPATHPSDEGAVSVGATGPGGSDGDGIFREHRRGQPHTELKKALEDSSGKIKVVNGGYNRRGQTHWYMETQTSIAVPDEYGGVSMVSSAQSTNDCQALVADLLGLQQNRVKLDFRRVGGAFGGKAQRSIPIACAAASAAVVTEEPVRLVLPRYQDQRMCGGRQELETWWQAAVNTETKKIIALRWYLKFGQGHSCDFGILLAAIGAAGVDQVYTIPHIEVLTHVLKTQTCARPAVRAPGHFEATQLAEVVMGGIAQALGVPSVEIREANFIAGTGSEKWGIGGGPVPVGPVGDFSHHALWAMLKKNARYEERLQAAVDFNKTSRWLKRGVSITPAKYGMFRFSGMTARIQVFKDASIIVNVAGSELGQGLHTKVAQVISHQLSSGLGVPVGMDVIHFGDNSSHTLVNSAMTGGSTTSEGACFAAEEACHKLIEQVKDKAKGKQKWTDVINACFEEKVLGLLAVPPHLEFNGQFRTPLQDLAYETFGVALAEVECDAHTGETRIIASHLLFDCGPSLNPAIDIGQFEGAFIMGLGQILQEGLTYDPDTGANLSDNTWTYKPPIATDIPESFVVELVDMEGKRLNTSGHTWQKRIMAGLTAAGKAGRVTNGNRKYRGSKAIGEPPVLLSVSIYAAIQEAVRSFRADKGLPAEFTMPSPVTAPVLHGVFHGAKEFDLPAYPFEVVPEPPQEASGGCSVQ